MTSPFHAGERAMQQRAGVIHAEEVGRMIRDRLTPGIARALATHRLAALSSVDRDGRVWASVLTGPPGFVSAVDDELVRIAAVPAEDDPLAAALAARPELGLLVIDLGTRQRIRVNGRAILRPDGLFLSVAQVYGNCPKYIQRRAMEEPRGAAVRDRKGRRLAPARRTSALSPRQQALIARSDTLFIASVHPESGADVSHRGGRPGFVRVLGPRRLTFADHPGNGMFNTLGNLLAYPRAGLAFVDFETGDLLHLTGHVRIGEDRAVTFDLDEARERPGACALRGRLLEAWPGPPPSSHAPTAGI